ncbi:MarR family winged helix-turn-helix transcriptional regulator [Bacillus sp. 2205SS5-2]|uniref:MarR family winged helix-turn-helix transcriptional regulator n=1 Tax=Bacillus sp. 2205SS5-2 TaxID=3109031 RepID=UPI00300667BC
MKTHSNLSDSICFLISNTGKAIINQIANSFKESGFDVTYEQWTILTQLWDQDGRTQNELANMTSRDQTCTSRLLDNLVKRGYITRNPSENDRRIKEIYLTVDGQKIRERLSELAQQTITQATEGISEKELASCKQVLKTISTNLQ